jgi:hypothetical protein
MLRTRLVCTLSILLFLNGCAYVFRGADQSLTINTRMQDLDVSSQTICKAQNDQGVWSNASADPLSNTLVVHRSGGPLQINCHNGLQEGSKQIEAEFNPGAYLFFDLLLACLPCIVDVATHSFFTYGHYSGEEDNYAVAFSMNRIHYDMGH